MNLACKIALVWFVLADGAVAQTPAEKLSLVLQEGAVAVEKYPDDTIMVSVPAEVWVVAVTDQLNEDQQGARPDTCEQRSSGFWEASGSKIALNFEHQVWSCLKFDAPVVKGFQVQNETYQIKTKLLSESGTAFFVPQAKIIDGELSISLNAETDLKPAIGEFFSSSSKAVVFDEVSLEKEAGGTLTGFSVTGIETKADGGLQLILKTQSQ